MHTCRPHPTTAGYIGSHWLGTAIYSHVHIASTQTHCIHRHVQHIFLSSCCLQIHTHSHLRSPVWQPVPSICGVQKRWGFLWTISAQLQCGATHATCKNTTGITSTCSSQHREQSWQKEREPAIICNAELASSSRVRNSNTIEQKINKICKNTYTNKYKKKHQHTSILRRTHWQRCTNKAYTQRRR